MPSPEAHFARFRQHADARALAAVFDALAPELLLVAAHVAASGSDAEDLLQATFLDAIEKADRWDAQRPLLPWLIGILVNHARKERRRHARRIDAARLPRSEEPSPLDALAASEVAEQVAAALRSLPRQLRQALTLRLVHGLTPTAIAHALGCPVATAKTRLQRGMEWLRKVLPAGIAVSVAGMVTAGRGLAAVRAVVLSKAELLLPVAAGAVTTGVAMGVIAGGLLMKKLALVVFAVLCVTALWVAVPRANEPARAGEDVAASPAAAQADASSPKSSPLPNTDASDRIAVATDAKTTGSLALEFVWKGYDRPAEHLQFWWHDADKPTGLHRCHADAQGRMRITDLPPADYVVFNLGNPRVPPLTVRAGEETHARIELEPDLRIDGMVVDTGGRGIAGAAVYVRGFDVAEDCESRLVAITAADGSFHGCSDRGGSFWAQHPGYVPSALQRGRNLQAAQLHFALGDPGCTLRGTAIDANGRGVSDARITIVRTSPRQEAAAPLTLLTDATGAFVTDQLAPGEHLLLARATGFAPTVLPFTSTADATSPLLVPLDAGATVTGSVVDGDGNAIVALVQVQLTLPGEPDSVAALSPLRQLCEFSCGSTGGSYRIEHLPATSVVLHANAAGKLAWSRTLQLLPGEVRCNIDLRAGGEIRGHVVDAEGKPLAKWNVEAKSNRRAQQGWALSGADGSFALAGLETGDYLLFARPSYDCDLRAAAVTAQLGQTDVLLRASCSEAELGRFTFTVLDATGAPMRSAGVCVASLDGFDDDRFTSISTLGTYSTQLLPPGRYDLSVSAPDQSRLRIGARELPAGATVDLGTVRMPKTGTMALRFDAANGLAAAPEEISARDDAGNAATLTRGDDGVYRSQPLPAGSYSVVAWGASIAPVAQDALVVGGRATLTGIAVAAATPVTFVMTRAGIDAKSQAQVRFLLASCDGVRVAARVLEMETRAFRWTRGLLPGSYTYEATLQPDGEPVRGTFTVAGDGSEPRVEIPLQLAK